MKYVFSHGPNKDGVDVVCCVSHFAGKPVRGFAKCNPIDQFDLEKGMRLAQLRCDAKIAEKRIKRAQQKFFEAAITVVNAQKRADDMQRYLNDSLEDGVKIREALVEFENIL